MGFSSFVGSCISACVSAVGSLGSALSSFASGISAVVGAICTALPQLGEALGQFANGLLKGLGILHPHEDVKDIGERALQAQEKDITADKFDNFDDYIEALRSFELDPKKAEKRDQAEKLSAGVGIGTVALEKRFDCVPGTLNGVWLLPLANPEYFTVGRIGALLSDEKFNGDIYAYLDRRLSAGDSSRFMKTLANASSIEDKQAFYQALDTASDEWKNIQETLSQKKAQQ